MIKPCAPSGMERDDKDEDENKDKDEDGDDDDDDDDCDDLATPRGFP